MTSCPAPVVIIQGESRPVQLVRPIVRVTDIVERGPQGPRGQAGSNITPIDFTFGDASSIVWVPGDAGLLSLVRLFITVPFNGVGAAISVGTASDPEALMPAAFCDPTAEQGFENTPDVELASGEGVRLVITPGTGATAGAGVLLLQFLTE